MHRLCALALTIIAPFAIACGAADKPAPVAPAVIATPAVAPIDPELVALEGALGNKYVKTDQQGEVLAHLRITTRDLAAGPRPVLNLALAVDTSGSMSGAAIENARAAAIAILDQLRPGDKLSVVVWRRPASYGGSASEIGLFALSCQRLSTRPVRPLFERQPARTAVARHCSG